MEGYAEVRAGAVDVDEDAEDDGHGDFCAAEDQGEEVYEVIAVCAVEHWRCPGRGRR